MDHTLACNQTATKKPLFVNKAGQALDDAKVRKVFEHILRRAGLAGKNERGRYFFTPHSLRHTFATHLLQRGVPVSYVATALGHSSPSVTLDWYWWAVPSGGSGYVDLLDEKMVTSGDQTARERNSDEAAHPL